jgi:hypothetical protein
MSNQRQLVAALLMYAAENKGYFPGGAGDLFTNGVAAYTPRLASWDTEVQNPYSCNQDPNNGPIWLAKYVANSKKIPACPEEPGIKDSGMAATNYRTSYQYPMSLVYKPEEIFNAANIGPTTVQTPQKITAVRHPLEKVVIIDRKTYHDKVVFDVDRTPPSLGATGKTKRFVTVGFADSHVDYRSITDMLDTDVNWTGRNVDPNEAGVLGRDFR